MAPLLETPRATPVSSKTDTETKSWFSLVHADFLNDRDESGRSAGKDTASPAYINPEISGWGLRDRVRRRAVCVGAAMSQTGLCLLAAMVLQAR